MPILADRLVQSLGAGQEGELPELARAAWGRRS